MAARPSLVRPSSFLSDHVSPFLPAFSAAAPVASSFHDMPEHVKHAPIFLPSAAWLSLTLGFGSCVMLVASASHKPEFQTLKRKQVFNIKHTLCTNCLGIMSHSFFKKIFGGLLWVFIAVHRLLIEVASLVEHRLQACRLRSCVSWA